MVANGGVGRIKALTGVRFLAAIFVVFYHFGYAQLIAFPPPLARIFGQGKAGVSLFFVLSGFILFYNYEPWFRERVTAVSFRQFARARFARIYPLYLLALLIVTPGPLYLLYRHAGLQLAAGFDGVGAALSWLLNLLLLQVYVPKGWVEDAWNVPAWSLCCEAVFYASMPFFISAVLSRVRRPRGLARLLAGLYAAEVALFLALSALVLLTGIHSDPMAMEYITNRFPLPRVWEFFIGCTLAALWRCKPSWAQDERARNWLLLLALAGMLGLAFTPGAAGGWGELLLALHWYVLYTPLFALAIFLLASGRTFVSGLLEHPVLLLLGEASYAVYIIHWAFYGALVFARSAGAPVTSGVSLLAVVLIVAVAVALLKLVETPARRLLRGPRAEAQPARGAMAFGL